MLLTLPLSQRQMELASVKPSSESIECMCKS
jgi:hypothetical protein